MRHCWFSVEQCAPFHLFSWTTAWPSWSRHACAVLTARKGAGLGVLPSEWMFSNKWGEGANITYCSGCERLKAGPGHNKTRLKPQFRFPFFYEVRSLFFAIILETSTDLFTRSCSKCCGFAWTAEATQIVKREPAMTPTSVPPQNILYLHVFTSFSSSLAESTGRPTQRGAARPLSGSHPKKRFFLEETISLLCTVAKKRSSFWSTLSSFLHVCYTSIWTCFPRSAVYLKPFD